MEHEALARAVLGRQPLFEADFAAAAPQLAETLGNRTVLVVGAGGSIGRATAELLAAQQPRRLLLVDISENNLVSITRTLRNLPGGERLDMEAWALDFCGPGFAALLARERPDVVLNFAAFKHVRSEKDLLSLGEMLRVNVLGNLGLARWAVEAKPTRLFAISTDKAAGPVSCMGASKRLMETILWSAARGPAQATTMTSTRFANVLFSDGSLPASFLERLEQRQPLAGPSDVLRFFITPAEAARLCLLAASHPQTCEFLAPRLAAMAQLSFVTIAEGFLSARGWQPRHYGTDFAAATANLERDVQAGDWPCAFTPSTTSGEKDAEEFTEPLEKPAAQQLYAEIDAIHAGDPPAFSELGEVIDAMQTKLADPQWLQHQAKADAVAWLASLVPTFRHLETGASLDQKI